MLKFWTRGCRTTLLPIEKKFTVTKLWQKCYGKEIWINWAKFKEFIFYKSDIFCKLFTFNLDFPSLRFPLATFLGCCHFPIFHTFLLIPAYFSLLFLVKKNRCQIKSFWVDVKYFGYHTVRSCEDGLEKLLE